MENWRIGERDIDWETKKWQPVTISGHFTGTGLCHKNSESEFHWRAHNTIFAFPKEPAVSL